MTHLDALSKKYPNAWQVAEYCFLNRGKAAQAWPDWCFLPMDVWYHIVANAHQMDFIQGNFLLEQDVLKFSTLGSWRYSQGIYRFDSDMSAILTKTVITGEMPCDVLLRLPEPCPYIETPGLDWAGTPLRGFWVVVGHYLGDEEAYLNFLLDTGTPVPMAFGGLRLRRRTLREATNELCAAMAVKYPQLNTPSEKVPDSTAGIQPLLSLVLYLCSDEPEIENDREPKTAPKRPELTKTKKGLRLFPPDRCRIWHVGRATGETLRRASASGQLESKGVRPHLRRPHWHGFWTGPLNGERRFGYKWLPTIMVRGRIDEEDVSGRPRGRGIREEKA